MYGVRVSVMVLNATFNNISVISWQSFLLVGENHRPAAIIMLYRVNLNICGIRTHNVSN
jgi:hypothetical protein